MSDRQLRWFAVSILFLSSALNYLDRSILSALMPTLRAEFGITGTQLGQIISAFSIAYAICAPLMGLFIDRVGLRMGASLAVGAWSLVGIATGFVGGLGSLMGVRALLGVAESGGIPVTGKGSAVYLEPRDRALGSAVSQIGLTLGIMGAPILTELVTASLGWRWAFVCAGLLGFVWIPIWLLVSRKVPGAKVATDPVRISAGTMLRDRRFQALIVANALLMTVYSLWTTWTTEFLVRTYGMTQRDANLQYAWIPPLFATLGGLVGGLIAQRLIKVGASPVSIRVKISTFAALLALFTGLAPLAGSPGMATAMVCISYFGVLVMSVNYYSIPLDLFGAGRAAFATSFLVSVFGLMQSFLAPLIGRWTDAAGWGPVCVAIGIMPLFSTVVLRLVLRERRTAA